MAISHGYSSHIINQNKKADPKLLGVRLGRLCIKNEVPVAAVMKKLCVSKQTVYNWFSGTSSPQNLIKPKVEAFISTL